MPYSLPSNISDIQPLDYVVIENRGERLFILYPKSMADSVADLIKDKTGCKLYPIGTFISGDIVCWEEGDQIVVVLHDSYELDYSDVPLSSFIERLKSLDPNLEKDVYGD